MITVLSFNDVLIASQAYSKRHLLLGNGFSIACIPEIFTYGSLYGKADFSAMPELTKVFESLQTQDFELVINTLENSAKIIPAYGGGLTSIGSKMHWQAQSLKEKLIQTVAHNHPFNPSIIENGKYDACIKFLSNFIDTKGNIYTINYDLLLYWCLMYGWDRKLILTQPNDGFGRDVEFQSGEVYVSDYLTWQGDKNAHGQNIHYLHGALHIYDRGHEVEKFNWTDTRKPLIDQAREALQANRFPLFVAEGESDKKMEKIIHSGYLYHSYKSFSTTMSYGGKKDKGKCCLFTFGVSFSANDMHIMDKISNGNVAQLYISVFGKPDTNINKQIIAAAENLKRKRRNNDLKITYYDAASAKVWG
jgi:hypothetical protein